MTIKYPTFRIKTSPTPANTIWICDKCGKAEWYYSHRVSHINFPICYCCKSKKGNPVRMRVGTTLEQAEAIKALKFKISEGKASRRLSDV